MPRMPLVVAAFDHVSDLHAVHEVAQLCCNVPVPNLALQVKLFGKIGFANWPIYASIYIKHFQVIDIATRADLLRGQKMDTVIWEKKTHSV